MWLTLLSLLTVAVAQLCFQMKRLAARGDQQPELLIFSVGRGGKGEKDKIELTVGDR